MPHAQAEKIKAEGNAFFKGGQYAAAIEKYDAASAIDSTVPAYQSNAAACWEKLGDYENMEKAARQCISADKKFVKGYFRLATALKHLNNLPACIKALESGLGIQSTNSDLKKMKKEVAELQRGDQVAAYCSKAEEQMQGGDIAGAYKTLELASRLDAGNSDIERMMKKVKPKFEQQEAKRKSGLSSTALYKEKGDEAYKVRYVHCMIRNVPMSLSNNDCAQRNNTSRGTSGLKLKSISTVLINLLFCTFRQFNKIIGCQL